MWNKPLSGLWQVRIAVSIKMITIDWYLDFIIIEAFVAHQVSRLAHDNDDIACYLLGR
jgi:hypothetical protein